MLAVEIDSAVTNLSSVVNAAPVQIPGWLARSVVVSFIGTGMSLYLHYSGRKSAHKIRQQDFRRSEFDRMAGTAIEAALEKLEALCGELRIVRTQVKSEIDNPKNRQARVVKLEQIQTTTGNSAREALEIALQRAQTHFERSKDVRIDWLSLIDLTDSILDGFNVLCRTNLSPIDVQTEFAKQLDCITKTCLIIRSSVSKANHVLAGFSQ